MQAPNRAQTTSGETQRQPALDRGLASPDVIGALRQALKDNAMMNDRTCVSKFPRLANEGVARRAELSSSAAIEADFGRTPRRSPLQMQGSVVTNPPHRVKVRRLR